MSERVPETPYLQLQRTPDPDPAADAADPPHPHPLTHGRRGQWQAGEGFPPRPPEGSSARGWNGAALDGVGNYLPCSAPRGLASQSGIGGRNGVGSTSIQRKIGRFGVVSTAGLWLLTV